MEWITLTTTDLEGVMTEAERGLAVAGTSQNLPDRLEPVLVNLAAEIQTMIATWSPNTVSADPLKIPPGFKARALVLARGRVLTGIPDYVQDEDRRKENENAEKWFQQVATGKIRPPAADDAVPSEVPGEKPSGVEIVSGPGSRTGRARMDGI